MATEGFVWKQGAGALGRRSYKRRWLVLRDKHLLYYPDASCSSLLGTIELPKVRDFRISNPGQHTKKEVAPFAHLALDLECPDRTYVIVPETADDRERWVRAIASCVERRAVSDALATIAAASPKKPKSRRTPLEDDDDDDDDGAGSPRRGRPSSRALPLAAPAPTPAPVPAPAPAASRPDDPEIASLRREIEMLRSQRVPLEVASASVNSPARPPSGGGGGGAFSWLRGKKATEEFVEVHDDEEDDEPLPPPRKQLHAPLLSETGRRKSDKGSRRSGRFDDEDEDGDEDDDEDDDDEDGDASGGKRKRKGFKCCCECCGWWNCKVLFVVSVNAIVAATGVAIVALAAYILKYKNAFSNLFGQVSFVGEVGIGVGVGILLMAILGSFGATRHEKKKGKCLLFVYFIILVALIIVELAGTILLFVEVGTIGSVKVGAAQVGAAEQKIHNFLNDTCISCCIPAPSPAPKSLSAAFESELARDDLQTRLRGHRHLLLLEEEVSTDALVGGAPPECAWVPSSALLDCTTCESDIIAYVKSQFTIIAGTILGVIFIQILASGFSLRLISKRCCSCLPCCRSTSRNDASGKSKSSRSLANDDDDDGDDGDDDDYGRGRGRASSGRKAAASASTSTRSRIDDDSRRSSGKPKSQRSGLRR